MFWVLEQTKFIMHDNISKLVPVQRDAAKLLLDCHHPHDLSETEPTRAVHLLLPDAPALQLHQVLQIMQWYA